MQPDSKSGLPILHLFPLFQQPPKEGDQILDVPQVQPLLELHPGRTDQAMALAQNFSISTMVMTRLILCNFNRTFGLQNRPDPFEF